MILRAPTSPKQRSCERTSARRSQSIAVDQIKPLSRWTFEKSGLALSFVAEELPDLFDEAMEIFSQKGAYSRFKQLVQATDTLDEWYAFEARVTETALSEWIDEVVVTLIDNEQPA